MAADFSTGRCIGMYVYIGVAGANSSDNFSQFLRPNLLANIAASYSHNARGGNRPHKLARSISTQWRSDWTGVGCRLAKPDNDATVHIWLRDMDMCLGSHGSLQSAVNSLIIDGLIVSANKPAKLTGRFGGHYGHFL